MSVRTTSYLHVVVTGAAVVVVDDGLHVLVEACFCLFVFVVFFFEKKKKKKKKKN